jgi:hypothetical protein
MSKCSIVTGLTVEDNEGNPKTVENTTSSRIKGEVAILGGRGISTSKDTDGALEIAVDGSLGIDNPIYKQKYFDIINGNPPFSQGVPFYTSSVNKQLPYTDGTLFLLGGACPQIGQFPDKPASELKPSNTPGQLEFFDLCEACLDCADYDLLCAYVDRIEEFIDDNKNNNLINGTQLFKQYQATVHYWNYIIHTQSLIFDASVDEEDLLLKLGYQVIGCGPYNSMYMTVTLSIYDGQNYVFHDMADMKFVYNPTGGSVTVSHSVDDTYRLTPGWGMEMKDYFILDCRIVPYLNITPPPAFIDADENKWNVTVTWYNSHVGAVAQRTKQVTTKKLI